MKPNYYSTLALKTAAFFLIWLLLSESFDGLHMGMGVVVAFAVAWLNTERSSTRSSMRVWPMLWSSRILSFHQTLIKKHLANGTCLAIERTKCV